VLGVEFREDAYRIRQDHTPANIAVVRQVALNLLRQDSSAKCVINAKRLKAGWDKNYIALIFVG